jgi:hypothetical protein
LYHIQYEDEFLCQDWLEVYITEILNAWTAVKDVIAKLHNLNQKQKEDLLAVLKQKEKLFTGYLFVYYT